MLLLCAYDDNIHHSTNFLLKKEIYFEEQKNWKKLAVTLNHWFSHTINVPASRVREIATLEQQGSICDFRDFRKLSLKNGVII